MARASHDDQVSLFPFLSVLSCVIGTLALLIAALAFGEIASDLASAAAPAEGLRAPDGSRTDASDAAAGEAEALAKRLAHARAVYEGTRAELRALGFDPDTATGIRRRSLAERERLVAARETLPTLEAQAERLSARRTGLEGLVPEAMRPDDEEAGIALLPSGSADALTPYFVECREGAIRFHEPESGESRALDPSDPMHRAAFDRYLQRVRAEPDATVVFLIRPDGVATYYEARRRAGNANVRHARLPLPGFGPLDFGAL